MTKMKIAGSVVGLSLLGGLLGTEAAGKQTVRLGISIVSGAGTEVRVGEKWVPAVAAWHHPLWSDLPEATWVWKAEKVSPGESEEGSAVVSFREEFTLPAYCANPLTVITLIADNAFRGTLNGVTFGESGVVKPAQIVEGAGCCEPMRYSLTPKKGANVVAFDVVNYGVAGNKDPKVNPAGLVYRIDIRCDPPK